MRRWSTLLLLAIACHGDPEGPAKDAGSTTPDPIADPPFGPPAPYVPDTCDAGDPAWVSRTLPMLWGRKPHGAAEIQYWAQMATTYGRPAVVRAMALDDQYLVSWADWFSDALFVARTGDKVFDKCFSAPKYGIHDGSLTDFLLANGPTEAAFGQNFDLADVIVDGLVRDDVSAVFRTYLLARMEKPTTGANVSVEELEYNRRIDFGEVFYRTYLGRNLVCMECHNSQFSTTDDPDPKLDRTWQMPGHFEQALLEQPTGRPPEEAYGMFKYDALSGGGGNPPWGWDNSCGELEGPNDLPAQDLLDQQLSYFIRPYDEAHGSVYDLERDLAAGVESLRGKGLTVAATGDAITDGTVDGQEAFAYLVAANLANQVWATSSGYDLTVAHMFPRNQGQMQRLQALADRVAISGFSMKELLVSVTSDPYFNPGLPSTCDAKLYGMDPVFNPWTVTDEDVARRSNGEGDAVHRLPARTLLRSVHKNLDWKPRDYWFSVFGGGSEESFQSAVGVFLRESDPGHRGTDFQGLLSFETEFGPCMGDPNGSTDIIDDILSDAVAQGATVGDVAQAVRDRLTSAPVDPEEQPLIEALLGHSFADPAENGGAFEANVRLFCGAVLESPQFQLVTDPVLGSAPPLLAQGVEGDCDDVARLMSSAGYPTTCTGRTLE